MDRITPVPAAILANFDKTVSRFSVRETEDKMAEAYYLQNAISVKIDVA